MGLTQVAMANTDPTVVYLAGKDLDLGRPIVLKHVRGQGQFISVLNTSHNENVATGWQGDGAGMIFNWGYGSGVYGLKVAAEDSRIVVITNSGSVLASGDGGAQWAALEILETERTPPNNTVPVGRSYHSSGLEDTTLWHVTWADDSNLFLSYTDIKGAISQDSGHSWSFNWTAPNITSTAFGFNTMFHATASRSGLLFAAVSSVHDMYQSTHLTDETIDTPPASHPIVGQVLVSSDKGHHWTTLHDLGRPVVWVSIDSTDSSQMYVSVANSHIGGVYRCGTTAGSACQQLPSPPRTQGHAWVNHVLPDGSVLVSYSGRRTGIRNGNGSFTNSSGVFLLPKNGRRWLDLSHPAMTQYTKDIVLCPHDPTGSTWYVAVAESWGIESNVGGLYRTTDRGRSWFQMLLPLAKGGVESVGVSPIDSHSVFVATEMKGLWHCCGDEPCTMVSSYPFFHPLRVLFSPFAAAKHGRLEMFVTSFGGGLQVANVTMAC